MAIELTTDQVAALACIWFDTPLSAESEAVLQELPAEPAAMVLARWVRQWVPVVHAAEAQTDAADALAADPDDFSSRPSPARGPWCEAVNATEAAVRAARAQEADHAR